MKKVPPFTAICVALWGFPLFAAEEAAVPATAGDVSPKAAQVESVKLTIEEQLKLRAAERKAAEDPAVLEALKKRNEAVRRFRQALHDSMVRNDPRMKAILDKIAVGDNPGF